MYILLALYLPSIDETRRGLDDSGSSEHVGGEPGRARGYWSGSVTTSKGARIIQPPARSLSLKSGNPCLEGGKPSGQERKKERRHSAAARRR
jgi:hypothetical protein